MFTHSDNHEYKNWYQDNLGNIKCDVFIKDGNVIHENWSKDINLHQKSDLVIDENDDVINWEKDSQENMKCEWLNTHDKSKFKNFSQDNKLNQKCDLLLSYDGSKYINWSQD